MCASGLHPAGAVAALGQDSRRAGGCAHWSAPDGHPRLLLADHSLPISLRVV